MGYIVWFKDLKKENVSIAGGKGAQLGELLSAGMPVPNGFVVSADAYKRFLEETEIADDIDNILKTLDVDKTERLNLASKTIKAIIINSKMPADIEKEIVAAYEKMSKGSIVVAGIESEPGEFVAVRSSATAEDLPNASFAGQQKTFLNVRGKSELLKAVKECCASLFESRAIFYRAEKGFDHKKVLMSVIVQKMIDSYKSGVIFTVDPITDEKNNITIEASWGLGEAVVSGEITPDHYIVDKNKLEVLSSKISEKSFMYTRDIETGKTKKVNLSEQTAKARVLDDEELKGLAKLAKKIEAHYNFPQDIEWAIEGNDIYILQSRPITTLKPDETEIEPEQKTAEDIEEILEKETGKEDIAIADMKIEDSEQALIEAGAIEEKTLEETAGKEVLVKGFGASPGIESGKVKIITNLEELEKVHKGDILVTKMTTPDMVPAMERATAIVTNEGGITCHAAIVSRELGIPCIVGTGNATQVLKDGMEITVDAEEGVVYAGIVKTAEKEEKPAEEAVEMAPIITATKIYVNLGVPSKAEETAKLPVDGVGLMREEFIFASSIGEHPLAMMERGESQKFIDALADGIAKVAKAFSPRPVVLRLSDFKTNEYKTLKGGEKYEMDEQNPMIGWRGCSRYVSDKYKEAFKLELKAVKKVREEMGLKNVWIMLPFVRNLGDVQKVAVLMEEEGLKRGDDLKLWMMAEVPSNVILADEFSKLVDGFSIGSNDLTQLIMGADRDSEILAELGYFDERNEAVKRAIAHLITVAHQNNCTVSICGQAPSNYPEFTKFLIEHGIDSISVNSDAAVKTRKLVAETERKILLEKIRAGESLNTEQVKKVMGE